MPPRCGARGADAAFEYVSAIDLEVRAAWAEIMHIKPLEGVEVLSGFKVKHPVLAQGRPRPLRDIGLISGDCIHALQCHQRTVRSLHRASADVLPAPYSAEVRAPSIGRAKGAGLKPRALA